jgi:predicted nucleotidyltransferase/DNA-binding XRE family transcriptional regulator
VKGPTSSSAAFTLRKAREEAQLSQEDLGARAGVTQSTISMYESGRREPSTAMLAKLVRAAGFDLVLGLERSQVSPRVLPDSPRARRLLKHRKAIRSLAARAGVSNVRVFGSVARGEDSRDSDIDLVVDVMAGTGMFKLIGFQRAVSSLLNDSIDVVPYRGLKESVRQTVDRDAISV